MAARVQIVVEAKDASSGVLRAITGQLGALGGVVEELTASNVNWGNVAQMATTMVIEGFKDAVKVTLAYADSVRDLALVSGTGAEESSRLLQVLDDYQISAEDVTSTVKKMTAQGLTPTVETLAQLSDAYLAINDPMERNDFLLKSLGKSGLQWVNALQQGGDALRSQSAGISENLILTDKQIQQTERYRLKMDEVGDTLMGWKVAATLAFFDVTDKAALHQQAIERVAAAHEMNAYVMTKQQGTYADEIAAMETTITNENELTESLKNNTMAVAENVAAIAEIDYGKLITDIQSVQQETDRYNETNAELNAQIAGQTAKIQTLTNQGYSPLGKTIQDEQAKLDELNGKLEANAKQHQKWAAQTVFAFAQARAAADGSISKGEGEVLIDIGKKLGLFDQQTAEAMEGVNSAFESVDSSNAQSSIDAVNDALNALNGTTATTYINVITTNTTGSTGGGTGGGGPGCFIAGTQIALANGGEMGIDEIEIGDEVIVYDIENKIFVTSPVTRTLHHPPSDMPGFYLLINDRVAVTPNHKLYGRRGWIPAGDLRMGDSLFASDGEYERITSIEIVNERVPVYDLEVGHSAHNYFADGILAHNKQTGGTVYAGAPYMVGEGGAEPFIPSQNGRILGHAESLHALTLGGGGGQTNYFYGPVTLLLEGEGGNDLLNVR